MTTLTELKHLQGNSIRARVQRFGGFLAGMIMPNIGAFIAWGLITALFIPTGWLPNATLAELVSPMITVLLPVLIGYTGGRLVHGQRGAVVGAVATMGVVVGTDVPMFLGAMIIAPIAAMVMKGFDRLVEGKIRTGFEMLINNFSAGIIGGGMALLGLVAIGPVVEGLTTAAGNGVDALVDNSLLPLVSLIVEPAKVLFLNNAINHGVLSPLGGRGGRRRPVGVVHDRDQPGARVGDPDRLPAVRAARDAGDGAGRDDHPLPRRHSRDLLPVCVDEASADPGRDRRWHGGGGHRDDHQRRAGGDPVAGQHLRLLAVTPRGGHIAVLLSIIVAAGVSFGFAAVLLGFGRTTETEPEPVTPGSAPAGLGSGGSAPAGSVIAAPVVAGREVTTLVVACDAGMGSSVMLASQMRKRLEPYGVTVEHVSVKDVPADAKVVLTHADLAGRARTVAPNAVVVEFRTFLGDPVFDQVEAAIRDGGELRG